MNSQCDVCTTKTQDIILPEQIQGEILYCTCPFCNKKVGADIFEGTITCPACGAQTKWDTK